MAIDFKHIIEILSFMWDNCILSAIVGVIETDEILLFKNIIIFTWISIVILFDKSEFGFDHCSLHMDLRVWVHRLNIWKHWCILDIEFVLLMIAFVWEVFL